MQLQKSDVQLRENQVLVLSRVGGQSDPFGVARQIFRQTEVVFRFADQKALGPARSILVEERSESRTAAVDMIEIQRRAPKIPGILNIRVSSVQRSKIEREIVIDELTKIRVSGWGQVWLAFLLQRRVVIRHGSTQFREA